MQRCLRDAAAARGRTYYTSELAGRLEHVAAGSESELIASEQDAPS